MSLIGGEYDSSGVWDGTYWDWKHAWIPLTVTIVDDELKEEAECPSLHREPLFAVEVYDVETEETTVFSTTGPEGCVPSTYINSVSISRNVEGQSDSFNMSLTDCRAVSPRLANDVFGLLDTDIRKHVRIKAGFRFNGVDRLVRIFTGVVLRRGENWNARGSRMNVSGLSLTYLLTLSSGTIEDYQGYLSGLVMDLMEQARIPAYVLAFDDRLFTEPFSLIADTVQEALEDLFQIESTVEWYVDAYGTLIMRDASLDQDTAFVYQTGPGKDVDTHAESCGNILSFGPTSAVDRVITEVAVIGANLDASITYVDAAQQERLGRRTTSINSALIETQSAAISAAQDAIAKSRRSMQSMALEVTANPILDPFMKLEVKDLYFGTGYTGFMTVLQLNHEITPTAFKTKVAGEFDKEV